jgi:MFS transporter, UMF1 family
MAAITLPVTPAKKLHRRRILGWAFYDWANSAIVTLVIATVYPIYYNSIARGELGNQAASVYAFTLAIALFFSAISGPIIGTLADLLGARKRLLMIVTVLGSVAVMAMFTVTEGAWLWGSALFILVQLFINNAFGLYDSLLAHISTDTERGRVSALGYGLGYLGGGLQLALSTVVLIFWQELGLPSQAYATRLTIVGAGIWWLIFALPLMLFVPEPPASHYRKATQSPLAATFGQLRQTLREIRNYGQLFKMLLAFVIYSEGIGSIISLATTYGTQQLGLGQTTLIGALLLTQFVAFPYAIIYGSLADSGANRRDVYAALMVWTAATFPVIGFYLASQQMAVVQFTLLIGDQFPLVKAYANASSVGVTTTIIFIIANQLVGIVFALLIGRHLIRPLINRFSLKHAIAFGLAIYSVVAVWGYFLNSSAEFWLLAFLVGTVQGGTQALSRALYSKLSPPSKSGEFFGFYGFSDKFAGIIAPVLFGLIGLSGNLRPALISVTIFFIIGGFLVLRVDEARGQAQAEAAEALATQAN